MKTSCPLSFDLAGVQVADDKLRVLINEHAWQGQRGACAAERGQLAAEKQLGQQQVAHHVQVAQDVEGDGGGEGDDAAAGQVVQDRAQAAEEDEKPEAAVVMQRPLQQSPVLQGQGRHGQDAEAGDGHQVEQEHGVDFLLLKEDTWANMTKSSVKQSNGVKETQQIGPKVLYPRHNLNTPGTKGSGRNLIQLHVLMGVTI